MPHPFLALCLGVSVSHAEPAPIVTLEPAEPGGYASTVLFSRENRERRGIEEGLPFDDAAWWHRVKYDTQWVALGFDRGDTGWTARSDLDGDGVEEVTKLAPDEDGIYVGTVTTTLEVPRPDALGGGTARVPFSVALKIDASDEASPRIRWSSRPTRTGTLPDGTRFTLVSDGGRYDTPMARFIVDENGDGEPDYGNRLVHFRAKQGLLGARGTSWTFAIDPAGDRVALQPSTSSLSGLRAGTPAPDFSVTTTDGATHTLAQYRGAPLVLDFWATWCGPCIALHPRVEETMKKYGVAVLGISADEEPAVLKRWLKKHPAAWPSAAVGMHSPVNKTYEVNSWPTHALIDAEGRLRSLGNLDAIEEALAGMRRDGELP